MTDKKSLGSLLTAAFFIIAGIVTIWDTYGYSDIDSQVFPRTVAIILIICATASFLFTLISGDESEGFGEGSWWRRILLVIGLLGACAAMPYLGFLLSGVLAFAAGMIAAMHDEWKVQSAILYSASGLVIMSAFYALFRFVLLVPLP